MRVEELLTGCDQLYVAFDGPVARLHVMPVAERLRVLIADAPLPRRVARTTDPYVVLAHAATIGPATEQAVYAQLCRVEFEVVGGAHRADGVRDALATVTAAGTQVTVVSGLNPDAVRSFLVMHGLDEHVRRIAAPDELAAGDDVRVFVGSTADDLAAARAAGVTVVRYRDEPVQPSGNPWFAALSTPVRRLP